MTSSHWRRTSSSAGRSPRRMRSSSSWTSRPAAADADDDDHGAEERRDHGEDRADDAVAGGVRAEEVRDVDRRADRVDRERDRLRRCANGRSALARDPLGAEHPAAPDQEDRRQRQVEQRRREFEAAAPERRMEDAADGEVQREPADPEQPVERVADAQRGRAPRSARTAAARRAVKLRTAIRRKREPRMPMLVLVARRRREDVLDRLGAAARQAVAVDDPLGRALASELRRHGAGDDRQRDHRRQRPGGEGDRAVEARHLLKAVDDAEQELGPQPERERPRDALAVHAPRRLGSRRRVGRRCAPRRRPR